MTDERNAASDAAQTEVSPAQTPQVAQDKPRRLSEALGQQFLVDPQELFKVIQTNIIAVGRDEPPATKEEVFHVMTVMQAYNLNPFVRQMYAFRSKKKLVISVPMDGWVALAKRDSRFGGVSYEFAKEFVKTAGGKMCWPWVAGTCYVAGRVPTVAYAFLEEWYVAGDQRSGPSNWDKYPCHRLKMKAYTLAVREALGIGLYDDADAEQFRLMERSPAVLAASTEKATARLSGLLNVPALPAPTPAEFVALTGDLGADLDAIAAAGGKARATVDAADEPSPEDDLDILTGGDEQ